MPPMFKTLLKQKIGAIETDYPLMGFTALEGKRQAWLFAEGIWKWQMQDLKHNANALAFNDWIIKTVQYLSSGEIKNKFRLFPEKNSYNAGENVRIYAEYVDASGNLSNQESCTLEVRSGSFVKNVKMSVNGERYATDLGVLPAGDFEMTAKLSGKNSANAAGRFAVSEVNVEMKNLTADHGLMRNLANRSGGSFAVSNNISPLLNKILSGNYSKRILKDEIKVTEFIHLKWIFALLILLFSAEWFLRKREGGY